MVVSEPVSMGELFSEYESGSTGILVTFLVETDAFVRVFRLARFGSGASSELLVSGADRLPLFPGRVDACLRGKYTSSVINK